MSDRRSRSPSARPTARNMPSALLEQLRVLVDDLLLVDVAGAPATRPRRGSRPGRGARRSRLALFLDELDEREHARVPLVRVRLGSLSRSSEEGRRVPPPTTSTPTSDEGPPLRSSRRRAGGAPARRRTRAGAAEEREARAPAAGEADGCSRRRRNSDPPGGRWLRGLDPSRPARYDGRPGAGVQARRRRSGSAEGVEDPLAPQREVGGVGWGSGVWPRRTTTASRAGRWRPSGPRSRWPGRCRGRCRAGRSTSGRRRGSPSVSVDRADPAAVVDPALGQEPLAVPHAVAEVERAEAGPVLGGGVHERRADERAGRVDARVGGAHADRVQHPVEQERPHGVAGADRRARAMAATMFDVPDE